MKKEVFRTEEFLLVMESVLDNIVHVTCTAKEKAAKRDSWMLTQRADEAVEFERVTQQGKICLRTKKMQILIDPNTLAAVYCDGDGNVRFRERQDRPRDLEKIPVYHYALDEKTSIRQKTTVDGVRVDANNFKKEFDRMGYHTKLWFDFQEDEAIMGFGSHEEGYLNLRGKSRFLYQQNMKAFVPFFWSTAGYGILFDSYTDMTFHDDGYGSYLWADVDQQMDYYVILGKDFDEIISGYRYLTGKPPMLPRWSFGYCQSKERYVDAKELLSVTEEYRKRQIPLDLIILDWKSWEGELWGEKIFDRSRFPDPALLTEKLHKQHAHMMISVWPHFARGGQNHRELADAGMLLLDDSTYNAFADQGRKIYWKQAYEGIFRYGVDAWWCDCTEPFEADWIDSPYKPEPEERQRMNLKEAHTYVDPEICSAYSLLHSKGIYEGQRSVSEKRVLNLTRSAYAGQQRYGTVTWSGDISANWETLKKQIAEGLSFVSSGCPYWTLDIGGFFVKNWMQWYGDGRYDQGIRDPSYRELYVRWLEYGTFLPMMRSHGTDFPREIWQFGETDSKEYQAIRKFIELRYRLLPYIYSVSYEVMKNDRTMMRPLAADFPGDPKACGVKDQFLFGPALMVCPVCEEGAVTRKVYLPVGTDWFNFWTGEKLSSGEHVADAPLDEIPVYVKAGSIVPMGEVVQYTGQIPKRPLDICVYPGKDSSFSLYDDDGESYAYEKGEYAVYQFTWKEDTQELMVKLEGDPAAGIYGTTGWQKKIMWDEEKNQA